MSHLVIVGLGHVGSDVLTDAVQSGLFDRISVIDSNQQLAVGEALDQHQATGVRAVPTTRVDATGYEACADADVIICAAGPSIIPMDEEASPADARNGLARVNSGVIREVMAGITAHTTSVPIVIITNPLDVIVHIAATEFGYPANLVFGTGTALDSARLRRIIADHAGVDPDSVDAVMLGEHGATAFPWASHATIGGMSLAEAAVALDFEPLDPEDLADQVVRAAFDVFENKRWTSAGIAAAAVEIAVTVTHDLKRILPVCSLAEGVHGFHGEISLSLPAVVGANGIDHHLDIQLDDWETQRLAASADAILKVYETVRPD